MMSQRRNQQDDQRIPIGHRRAECYKDIHVGAAVPEAFDAAHIIIPSRIKLHRCCQNPEQPVDPGRMKPGTGSEKVFGHAQNEKGKCEYDANNEFLRLAVYFGIPGSLFGIFRIFFGIIRQYGLVSRLFDSLRHGFGAGDDGIILHGYPLGCKINGCLDYPRNLAVQGAFDIHGAIGAAHAGYRKINPGGDRGVGRVFGHDIHL